MKLLKGEQFDIEAAESEKVCMYILSNTSAFILFSGLCDIIVQVSDLKLKIEQVHSDLKADRQKLIHAGKILKDDSSVSELGIKESDFLVCMATKEVSKVKLHMYICILVHAVL